ncbi:hypothetical protein [Halalkalibacter okhensis]|uniref:Uncharacterized protein n=1 Tax=Halalkalibacter okhensis TaxID=333138 RepID=A0A0B0IEU6_9BACI|nr:hypothetical protein [Halalkalibacter okhensis]KHF38201.1 hypothetical protein LQ50_22590 [Halalkalibacter okhensis]
MFSNQQLQDLIDGKIIGNKYPYDTNNELEIETHIKQLFYKINRIPTIICEAEWNHFGSGYASFVEFFCYRKEDVTVVEEKYGMQEIKTSGIIIDISRLAPVAIMGEDDRYKTICMETNEVLRGGYGTILDGSFVLNAKFQTMKEQLKQSLREFEYELLETEQLHQPLSFQTKIPTTYRKQNEYLVMDAIFYWED